MLAEIQVNRNSGYPESSQLVLIILICSLLMIIQFVIAFEYMNHAVPDPEVVSGSAYQADIDVQDNLAAAIDPGRYQAVAPEIMPLRLNEVRRLSSAVNIMRLIKSGH